MAYATAMSLVKAVLDNVVGVINTFDHHPRKETVEDTKTAFIDSGIYHTYFIRRITVDPVESLTDAQVWRPHIFQIMGFHQVDDSGSSEATFQAIVDLILDEFDTKDNLTLDGSHDQPVPARLVEFVDVQTTVGQPVLCHRATIEITVNEVANP